MRQGKDDMKVADRQDLVFSFFKPSFAWHMLAFGAVAIAARMIRNAKSTTVIAVFDITTEVSGAAV
jgi:hypothetical protein